MTQREFRMTKPKGTGGGSFRSRLAQLRAKAAGDCRTPRRWRAHRAQREITPNSWRMKFEKRPMKTEKLSQIKPNKTWGIFTEANEGNGGFMNEESGLQAGNGGGTCVRPPATAVQTLRECGSDGGLHGCRISYTSKCLRRRQTRSQRDPVHLQVAGTVLPCSNPKGGGVCRAATDFDCVAVTLRCGHAVTFERFRRLIPLRAGLGDGFFAARKTPPAAGRQGRSATVSTLGNAE